MYIRYDDSIGYGEEIDNGDPALIAKLAKEREDLEKEYYRLHPDEDPANWPKPANCRCYEVYRRRCG
jgi:hypothetical protein